MVIPPSFIMLPPKFSGWVPKLTRRSAGVTVLRLLKFLILANFLRLIRRQNRRSRRGTINRRLIYRRRRTLLPLVVLLQSRRMEFR